MARVVRILDATLREGAQAPGVGWEPASSVAVARALDGLGVDTIECGHPAIGGAERDRILAVVDAGLGAPLLCHARAVEADVDAVAEVGAPWVGLFLGVNPVSRRARVRKEPEQLLEQLSRAVRHAKRSGLRVRFTLEDASRTDEAEVVRAYDCALDSGADRLGWADTVGAAEPADVALAISSLRSRYAEAAIEVHLHDDRGLALASALAALEAGATWIAASVNGLGERCGIVDLASVLVNLAVRGDRPAPDGELLQRLSAMVAELSGAPPDARRPIVGANAFTHTAKLHVRAMERDEQAYAWIDARDVGRRLRLLGSDPN